MDAFNGSANPAIKAEVVFRMELDPLRDNVGQYIRAFVQALLAVDADLH